MGCRNLWEFAESRRRFEINFGFLRYDVLLTSETVYRKNSYEDLHALFDKLLADDGTM